MPTYVYECSECKHKFEVFQSMSADPVESCEKCGANVKRVICAGAGVIYKGSGFYKNDYKDSISSGKTIKMDKEEVQHNLQTQRELVDKGGVSNPDAY